MIIKLHHADKSQVPSVLLHNSKNILLYDDKIDLYTLLSRTDILLTDYSSVYFDFLLLNLPIIFMPFDLGDYVKKRSFYYNYNDVTPGHKTKNWEEVLSALDDVIGGVDDFATERDIVKRRFNEYMDGNSSKRVFAEILALN